MTAEAVEVAGGLIEKQGGLVGNIGNKGVKRKRCKRRGIKKSNSQEIIHGFGLRRLFLACRNVFKDPEILPSSIDVLKLRRILDAMVPEDVGLNRGLQFFQTQNVAETNARVTYATIYQSNKFDISLFFLPASSVIPLHNHPGMTVFSKLLLGTMHVKSYDWVEEDASSDCPKPSFTRRLARLMTKKVVSAPCDSFVLHPTSGGNIHEFRAVTPCAVLDVIGPPYSKEDGRDCSYYKDTPCAVAPNERIDESDEKGRLGNAWLEEIELPEESEMDVIRYMGPPVYGSDWE